MSDIYIGTAGWLYKDWNGIVYPEDLKKKKLHPLAYLAQFFDLVEINTSFYGHVAARTGAEWCRLVAEVNPRFRFTAKLNRAFTHSPIAAVESTSAATIRPAENDERDAKQGLDSLAERGRLGALLAQFPISFKQTPENREYLDQLAKKFRAYPLAVEVRHASWNNPELLQHFAGEGIAFCNVDQPALGRSLRPTQHATSAMGYVRLHGRNYAQWFEAEKPHDRYNYLYKESELSGWKDKIVNLSKKTKVTFVVANNHFQGKAAVNALQLKSMISREKVRAPETLLQHYGAELKNIAAP